MDDVRITVFVTIFRKYFASEFSKNVAILASGAAIAQLIPVGVSPFLTRIYSPSVFGEFSVYLAISSLLVVFSTGRYDIAILEPKDDSVARSILNGCIILNAIFCFALLIFVGIIYLFRLDYSHIKNLGHSIWLIPISVFCVTNYQVFGYWLNRNKRFYELSRLRIVNNGSIALVSILCGLIHLRLGLIIGYLSGQMIVITLVWKKIVGSQVKLDIKEYKNIGSRYARYPRYLLLATLAGEASAQLPLIVFTGAFGSAIAGYFSLATRVTAAPIFLLGNAIGEVYRQKAFEVFHKEGNCRKLYYNTLALLCVIGLVPLIVLLLFSDQLFGFVFGVMWEPAGEIAKITSIMVFFQFLSTPMSFTIALNKSQRVDMYLQLARLIMVIMSVAIGIIYNNYKIIIWLYTLSYVIYYLGHSALQYNAACGNSSRYKFSSTS